MTVGLSVLSTLDEPDVEGDSDPAKGRFIAYSTDMKTRTGLGSATFRSRTRGPSQPTNMFSAPR
jgi:hypothetical protein